VTAVLAFDVYGTLIDTAGVVTALEPLVGAQAAGFAQCWRDKQVEYSFRRGLMQRYAPFSTCVREAFDYSCARFACSPPADERAALLGAYDRLPAFPEAAASLADLHSSGFALYAFSNGTRNVVAALLAAAGLDGCFRDIVSVDEVGSFKPDPAVYRHFLIRSGAEAGAAWLVSGNPLDVIGAIAAGLKGLWVRRSVDQVFDPWGLEPTLTVASLAEVGAGIGRTE